jgi:N-acetylmuramoyl-L-alanine amidase
MRKKNLITAAIILMVLTGNAPCAGTGWSIPVSEASGGNYASVYDFVTKTGAGYSFDPITRRGRLFRKEHSVIFMEGCSVAVADGKLIRADVPVIHRSSETLLPQELFLGAAETLFPELHIEKKGSTYTASSEPEVKKKKPAVKRPAAPAPSDDTDEEKEDLSRSKYASATAEKIGFIVLDAGHGGKDPGAVGKGKTYEKEITLSMVKKVGAILSKEHADIKIYYTRSTDVFVELGGRTEFANRKLTTRNGGLFISIHVNASVVPKMNGYETYYLSQTPSSSQARSTAALENNVVVLENLGRRKSYDDVEHIEALMATMQIQKESRTLAETIQKKMTSSMKEFPSRGVKTADFFVLRGSLMPAALVEIGYITNRKELSRLTDDRYQDGVAASIAGGIGSFLQTWGRSN